MLEVRESNLGRLFLRHNYVSEVFQVKPAPPIVLAGTARSSMPF